MGDKQGSALQRDSTGQKNPIETLSKDEIITKYKALLNLAKKAKQAKDELMEENRSLKDELSKSETQKEADKKALLTMKEMLEEFTQNKLQLATELSELKRQQQKVGSEHTVDSERRISEFEIENESLKRQLKRLTDENENILGDIDLMEAQVHQANVLREEQQKNLERLEADINRMKEVESQNASLQQKLNVMENEKKVTVEEYDQLMVKYQNVKEINSEQRKKFNSLKDRFIDVHRKLKNLKECKCVLLETQHEYADSVSKWQTEIVKASHLLCTKLNALHSENEALKSKLASHSSTEVVLDMKNIARKFAEIQQLGNVVFEDYHKQHLELQGLTQELNDCKLKLNDSEQKLRDALEEKSKLITHSSTENVFDVNNVAYKLAEIQQLGNVVFEDYQKQQLELEGLTQELNDCKMKLNDSEQKLRDALEDKSRLITHSSTEVVLDVNNVAYKLAEIQQLGNVVFEDYQKQELELQCLTEELNDCKKKMNDSEQKLRDVLEDRNKRLESNNETETNLYQTTKLSAEIELLSNNLNEKCQRIEDLSTQIKNSEEAFENLNEKFVKLNDLWSQSEETHKQLQMEITKLKSSHETGKISIKELSANLASKEKALDSLQSEYAILKQSLENSDNTLDEITELKNALQDQTIQITALESEKEKISSELKSLFVEKQALNTQLSKIQRNSFEDQETLAHSLNEKQKILETIVAKLEVTEAEYLELQEENETLKCRCEQKEREHDDLLDEMRELNEALKGRGDVISRQQEKHKELLNDLRNALHMKKELETSLASEQQAMTDKSEELKHANAKINELESELQVLRNQETNIDAQSDVLSTSTISRSEELSRLRELDDNYEEKYNKLRGLASKLRKKLQEQTAYANEMEQKLINANGVKKELDDMDANLKKAQQELTLLKSENQKLKTSRKQANVLNLEIDAAEKSLEEVSAKLTAKTNELDELNEILKTKENTNVQLRKEIAILETAKDAEATHSKQLKEQIDRMQSQVKDAVHSQQQAITQSKDLEQAVEKYKLEVEELNLQLANSASKHEAILLQSTGLQESLANKLQGAEAKNNELETSLRNAKRAYEDLRVEYLEYKVKAQAVLRKNQSKDTSKDSELEDEIVALRAREQQLITQAQSQTANNEHLEKQVEMLQEDNESVQRRCRELMNVIEELRQQNESLALDNQRFLQAQQESISKHRQQLDNIDAYHKTQVQQLQQQMEQMQTELNKATRHPPTIGASAVVNDRNAAAAATTTLLPLNANTTASSNSVEQSKIDFLLMEREAAEGSEEAAESLAQLAAKRKISNASRRSQHDFMPLDELLNTPLTAISDKVLTSRGYGRNSSINEDFGDDDVFAAENAQAALKSTREHLQIQESHVRHLTALLAENEQDLAKLTQMNDMLKEELRRQERSEEREQHMHNSEYLKNVFLKFLTLNNGDERMRLVPVLNTILKLSRNEAEMLSCVAKGQKVSSDSNNRSWGSFLSAWGSGGGSGGGGVNNNT